MSWVDALRAAYGALLVTRPDAVVRAYAGKPADDPARAVARVLGGRHLLQAAVTAASPRRGVVLLGAVADGLHAASGVALAAVDSDRRREALADASVAVTFAVAGVARARGR